MRRFLIPMPLISAALLPLPALAHTGVGPVAGFAAGVAHPLGGADHLMAMVAVGLLAGLLGGRAIWLVARQVVQDAGVDGVLAAARTAGVTGIGLHALDCDAAAVAAARLAGIAPGAWAVNGEDTIARVLALGVAVFTTDDPVTALRLRG